MDELVRILVTGSQGVLGRTLVRELKARGHEVTGVDLMHDVGVIRADVADFRQMYAAFSKVMPDAIYHLAAEFGRVNGNHYPEQLWRTNCLGTRNIVQVCYETATRLIFASSSEAYGSLADDVLLTEGSLQRNVPRFHNEYALTKWTNEKQIEIAMTNEGLNATILRFFNVYGPGERYNDYRSVVCLFIYRMLKNLPITVYQNCQRSFLYVDDWARTTANVCERELPNGEAYNVGSGEQVSIQALARRIQFLIPETKSAIAYLDTEAGNVASKRPSLEKSQSALGHKERVGLSDGLRSTVAWMRKVYAE